MKDYAKKFYKSYFLQSSESIPFIDAKLAISKDYFTINKKKNGLLILNLEKLEIF